LKKSAGVSSLQVAESSTLNFSDRVIATGSIAAKALSQYLNNY